MTMTSLTLVSAVMLSVLYGILGSLALRHVKPEEKGRLAHQLLMMDPWWPYYGEMYAESGRKLCLAGKALFPIVVTMYVLWTIQLLSR